MTWLIADLQHEAEDVAKRANEAAAMHALSKYGLLSGELAGLLRAIHLAESYR